MDTYKKIFEEVKNDPENASYTKQGIDPLFTAPTTAKILIIGQAPGAVAQEKGVYWDDKSGDRLREWMGVTREEFYAEKNNAFGIIPMDFYFPGKGKSGDLPPRKDFAEKWHPRLLEMMKDVQLTILLGAYAQHKYLNLPNSTPITTIIENYQEYMPKYFPTVHPSPRNNIWLAKNPWFEEKAIPALQKEVKKILGK